MWEQVGTQWSKMPARHRGKVWAGLGRCPRPWGWTEMGRGQTGSELLVATDHTGLDQGFAWPGVVGVWSRVDLEARLRG